MIILPVLDLHHGQVVHAIAGRRSEYRPISSRLTDSCRPLDVALAFRHHFGFNNLYIADLDAIEGAPPDLCTLGTLHRHGFACWVDAGIRNLEQAEALAIHVATVIAGLETLTGPSDLAEICHALGNRVMFSLDLKNGKPLGNTSAWPKPEPHDIARHAITLGIQRLLVLDLAQVGTATGPGTEELCSQLVAEVPYIEILTGGGIRTVDDIDRLKVVGVSGLLLASALHNGTLTPEVLSVYHPC